MNKKETKKICSICKGAFEGWGNNAQPINDGICCKDCNGLVIVARINQLRRQKNQPEFGKQYSLTGGTGTPSIAAGNTWAESEVKKPVKEAIVDFIELVQSLQRPEGDVNYRKISVKHGRKFSKIIANGNGHRSVYCFISLANGDILKAAGWNAPAKHARANIYDADGGRSGITEYGAKYMDALTMKAKMVELKK